jgi:hypothetical protein
MKPLGAMRFLCLVTLVVVGVGFAGMAGAQTREEMERCRTIENDARRLECYDAIRLSPGPPRTKYEPVDLEELKSFALSFRGQLVEVTGWITPDQDFLFLGIDETDERPVPIEFQNMSRRDRQAFLEQCGEGCPAAVQGRVRPVNFTTGIVADALIVR